MIRRIVLWPDPVLDHPTQPVVDFASLPPLIEEMAEAMKEAKGTGLAANQVGLGLRLALIGRADGSWFEIVNPEVLSREGGVVYNEGCLSIPGEWHDVPRSLKVRVRYRDARGEEHEIAAEERLAHVLQHEIDHLDGHVYAHHLSPLKRKLIREHMLKKKRDAGRNAR